MAVQIKQFIVPLFNLKVRGTGGGSFLRKAKRHIVRRKKGVSRTLSRSIDAVAYGI